MSFLSSFDVFPKYKENVKVKTMFGAGVSVAAMFIMLLLFIAELMDYLTIKIEDHLVIDNTDYEMLPINFNITLHRIPCSIVSLDVIDAGGSQLHVEEQGIIKHRLDRDGNRIGDAQLTERGGTMKEHEVIAEAKSHGVVAEEGHSHDHSDDSDDDDDDGVPEWERPDYCGSCYGAQEKEDQCCNTCESIKVAYHKKGWGIGSIGEFEQCRREGIDGTKEKEALDRGEGCNVAGYMQIKRSQGNFHIAPGYGFSEQHGSLHDFGAFQRGNFDTSHSIHHLSFGKELKDKSINTKYISYPLDGTEHSSSFDGTSIFQYYAKIVPTQYCTLGGNVEVTNQYSVTMHETKLKLKEGYGIPGVYFFYEFSPLMVQISEVRTPFFHFITNMCAIIGGVFTVTGLLDRVVYGTLKQFKNEMGKLG